MKSKIVVIIIPLLLMSNMVSAQEASAVLCADGIDNDADGLLDCDDFDCFNLTIDGCSICGEGVSFADVVLEYVSGCPISDPIPSGAVGLSDYDGSTIDSPTFTFLGQGGYIKLGFVNNYLSNSGDNLPDIHVFEVGPVVESMSISLRPADQMTEMILLSLGIPDSNNDGYFEIADIAGSTSSLDIDQYIPGQDQGSLVFDAIEVMDILDENCGSGSPGADIDAVCALSFSVVDCQGTINGNALIDDCGECLTIDNPNFNLSCSDCAGIPNGTSIIDDCGECLQLTDPSFNQSCSDCEGVPNGTAIIDDCGECLQSGDPLFNQSCLDCGGTPNGTAVIDECGECLEPNDPLFNQTCPECPIYIPNVFNPLGDFSNNEFRIFSCPEDQRLIQSFEVFDRWGNSMYSAIDFGIKDLNVNWNGRFQGNLVNPGVYIYVIKTTEKQRAILLKGDVLLIH